MDKTSQHLFNIYIYRYELGEFCLGSLHSLNCQSFPSSKERTGNWGLFLAASFGIAKNEFYEWDNGPANLSHDLSLKGVSQDR